MGETNLKKALERKYATLSGEFIKNNGEIKRIQDLYETVPALSERSQRIERLLGCAEELLIEIAPGWTPDKVKPVQPHTHKIPVPMGETSRTALDILRTADKNLTAREIAKEILARHGKTGADPEELKRVTNAVDASLRKKQGTIVDNDGRFCRRWFVINKSRIT